MHLGLTPGRGGPDSGPSLVPRRSWYPRSRRNMDPNKGIELPPGTKISFYEGPPRGHGRAGRSAAHLHRIWRVRRLSIVFPAAARSSR